MTAITLLLLWLLSGGDYIKPIKPNDMYPSSVVVFCCVLAYAGVHWWRALVACTVY